MQQRKVVAFLGPIVQEAYPVIPLDAFSNSGGWAAAMAKRLCQGCGIYYLARVKLGCIRLFYKKLWADAGDERNTVIELKSGQYAAWP